MDIVPSIHLQTPCNDEENGDNYVSEGIAFQEDAQMGKRPRRTDFVCAAAISTPPGHGKISSERQMKEGFGLSSPKMKAKRRTAEIIEVHGGRIIRSTGRKDRHSKVCTARGTRDRRVRLSPKTAILFYDVQDKLGYDRPSKAIDWLMKEAKASIDALDEAQPAAANVTEIHGLPNSKNHQTLRTGHGLIQNFEHFNDNNPISSFGLVTEGAAPLSSTEFPAYNSDEFNASVSRSEARQDYQVQFLSAPPLTTPSDIFGTNIETAKLQRNFSWNYANARGAGEDYSSVSALPLHFPALADLGHSFQREPLQSSYSRIPNYSPQFSGVSFSNEELLNFTAAATSKEDAMDY